MRSLIPDLARSGAQKARKLVSPGAFTTKALAAGALAGATLLTAGCGNQGPVHYAPLPVDNPAVRCTNLPGNTPIPVGNGIRTPTIQNGGQNVRTMKVKLVFVGGFWNTAPGRARRAALNEFERSQDSDPINGINAEYVPGNRVYVGDEVLSNIRPGVFSDADSQQIAADLADGTPAANVQDPNSVPDVPISAGTDAKVVQGQTVKPRIANSAFKLQDNTLYELIYEPGDVIESGSMVSTHGLEGDHGYFQYKNGQDLYAQLAYPSKGNGIDINGNAIDSLTSGMQHEELEAKDDPELGTGLIDPNRGTEIGDWTMNDSGIPENQIAQCGSDHFARQEIFSIRDQAYEIAEQPTPPYVAPAESHGQIS